MTFFFMRANNDFLIVGFLVIYHLRAIINLNLFVNKAVLVCQSDPESSTTT